MAVSSTNKDVGLYILTRFTWTKYTHSWVV